MTRVYCQSIPSCAHVIGAITGAPRLSASKTRAPAWLGVVLFLGLCACGQTDVLGTVADGGAHVDAEPDPEIVGAAPSRTDCAGAAQWFGQALCVCDQTSILGDLATITEGSRPGLAHVATGGPLHASGLVGPVDGDLRVGGEGVSVLTSDSGQIMGDLYVGGALAFDGWLNVAGDLWALGEISGEGELLVVGDVLIPGKNPAVPAAVAEFSAVRAPDIDPAVPGCLCDKKQRLEIKKFVMAQRDTEGEQGAAQDALQAALAIPGAVVDIPAGSHWIKSLENSGDLTLRMTGKSALFIYEDLKIDGNLNTDLADGAELSLFVAGNATLGGAVTLAPAERAVSGRAYIGGKLSMDFPGGPSGGVGYIYAPSGELTWSGRIRWVGSLYLQSLVALGGLEMSYDPGIRGRGELCEGP